MNALTCPRCAQLDQVQSVQSIFGAQTGMTHSTGVAVGAVIGAGPMAMGMTAQGTQASTLALQLAPPPVPRRASAWNCGVMVLFAVLIVWGLGALAIALVKDPSTQAADRLAVLAVAIVALCLLPVAFLFFLRQDIRYKRSHAEYSATWPAMTHLWQNTMICLRCHGAFLPPGVLPAELDPRFIPVLAFQSALTDLGTRLTLATGPAADPRALPRHAPPEE